MKRTDISDLKIINQYVNTHKLKIKQWDKLRLFMLQKNYKATSIRYLKEQLPKHWSNVLDYVINYIVLLEKGVISEDKSEI